MPRIYSGRSARSPPLPPPPPGQSAAGPPRCRGTGPARGLWRSGSNRSVKRRRGGSESSAPPPGRRSCSNPCGIPALTFTLAISAESPPLVAAVPVGLGTASAHGPQAATASAGPTTAATQRPCAATARTMIPCGVAGRASMCSATWTDRPGPRGMGCTRWTATSRARSRCTSPGACCTSSRRGRALLPAALPSANRAMWPTRAPRRPTQPGRRGCHRSPCRTSARSHRGASLPLAPGSTLRWCTIQWRRAALTC